MPAARTNLRVIAHEPNTVRAALTLGRGHVCKHRGEDNLDAITRETRAQINARPIR